ncbi:MAG: hypothetical protein JO060_05485 [Candidatus Eremiobacteraeota bacterium]|nr:hypothetical protein [Candidatus Eremiobacteraeota bacterium]
MLIATLLLATVDVLTFHNDSLRTGWNSAETRLTQATVSSSQFGVRATLAVDGNVYAQPLYVHGAMILGATHNVLIVATENDSVYAFDADTGATLWHTSFIDPTRGITAAPGGTCKQIQPWVGISSTPAIDRATQRIYVVAKTERTAGSKVIDANTLHALSLATGQDAVPPVLITGSARLSDGSRVRFDQTLDRNRPGLLLSRSNVYVGMGSNCDDDGDAVHGWVFAYRARSLKRVAVFNTTTDVARIYLATLWQSTYGLAADQNGSVYFATGNGAFDAYPSGNNYGDSVLRLSETLRVQDYFRPYYLPIQSDDDLGSGGVMLLPPQPGSFPNEAVVAGKHGAIELMDRDHLGEYTPSGPDHVLFELPYPGSVYGGPAYFADALGTFVYYAIGPESLQAYALTTSPPALTLSSLTATEFPFGGTIPSVSSNGTRPGTGIVWAVVRARYTGPSSTPLMLAAFDADDLSRQLFAGPFGVWQNPQGFPMLTPTIADGKVFVGGSATVTVFGLGVRSSRLFSAPRRSQ